MASSFFKVLLCLALLGLPCLIADDAACAENAFEDTMDGSLNLLQQKAKALKEVDSHKTHNDAQLLEEKNANKQQEEQHTRVDNEVSKNSGIEYSLTIYWVLGGPMQSCDQVCKAKVVQNKILSCDPRGFAYTQSITDVSKAVQGSGTRCKAYWANSGTYGAAFREVPAMCLNTKGCGADPWGMCAYQNGISQASCGGLPPRDYGRICPCNVASSVVPSNSPSPSSTSPSPFPSLGPSLSPSPSPSPSPAPSPSSSVSPRPSPSPSKTSASKKTCKSDTKVGCKITSCSKSLGPTTCEGSFFSKKCTCKKGYCFEKGKCIKKTI
eukprot:TRINITY_DN19084_c0_g1_i1.p1 TRINITY_DN19084_c0_g1~~TRINITY_DN19084_c0_g1_i1.p1  ORF type:complete len:324 (-),score=46.94 TRINITY_DN19084_c0_g1_i1:85-1056(-)